MLNPPVGVQTQDYIDALKADTVVHVKMTFAAQGITLTDQDIKIENGLTMNDILNGDIDLTFGKSVMKQLNVGVINSSRVANLIWTDEFTLELGVDINGTTKYVKIGDFIGERPNNITTVDVIDYTAYDRMQKFNVLADDFWDSVTFPATVEEIYHGLCDYVGIGYVSGDELPYIMARTFTTAPMQLQGYTCRDLLSWLAEACGCYAKVNADGNCKMVWFTDHTSSLAFALDDEFHIETADLYTGLIWDEFDLYIWNDADKLLWNDVCSYEEVYGVDCLQVRQLDSDADVNYPAWTGGNVYMIVENPFLSVESADDIENYIKPLWDRLSAFGGRLPVSVDCVGNWLVESGDIISLDVNDTMTISAPVYVRTLRWNGACRDTYETTGNVTRPVVSADNKEKLIARNNIRFVAKDLYYGIQSGIDIKPEGIEISGSKYVKIEGGTGHVLLDEDGVEITGNKYLKLESGGVLDVKASNFELNSDEKKMVTGNWKFDENGVEYNNNTFDAFLIGKRDNNNPVLKDKNGIFYYTEGVQGQDCAGIEFYACSTQYDGHTKYTAQLSFQTAVSSVDQKRYNTLILYDNGSDNYYVNVLGSKFFPFGEAYLSNLYIRNICNMLANTGSFKVYPRGLTDSYIVFQQYTNNGNQYTKIYGSVGANMIFEGVSQAPSSRDIKHDIRPLESQGELIDSLQPVSFVYDNDPAEQTRKGLIYEDTMEVAPEICSQDEGSKAIRYVELIPVLLKEIQDLRARVKELEERLGE